MGSTDTEYIGIYQSIHYNTCKGHGYTDTKDVNT